MATQNNLIVISALGRDRTGLIEELSRSIKDAGCNIIDSRMTVLGGEFAILLMAEGNWNTLSKLEKAIPVLEDSLEMTIIARRTSQPAPSIEKMPYSVEVVALDHPVIVNELANFFSSRQITIRDLSTSTYTAARIGSSILSVNMLIDLPNQQSISNIRDEFLEFCDQRNLDAVLEPLKNIT